MKSNLQACQVCSRAGCGLTNLGGAWRCIDQRACGKRLRAQFPPVLRAQATADLITARQRQALNFIARQQGTELQRIAAFCRDQLGVHIDEVSTATADALKRYFAARAPRAAA